MLLRKREPAKTLAAAVEHKGNTMIAIQRLATTSLAIVLLGGLVSACSTTGHQTTMTPEAIPAQVCGGNADSDGDGVSDCDDRCPGTIRGEKVDPEGCPIPMPVEPKPFRG